MSTSSLKIRGLDTEGILAAAANGEINTLLIAGVELADLPDPQAAEQAIRSAGFVISLELRESPITALADVVFPVAPAVEKAGSFVNWEYRIRPFEPALDSNAVPDLRVLQILADELGVDLGFRTATQARAEIAGLGVWDGTRAAPPAMAGAPRPALQPGQALLAGWRMLLDNGRLQDGEPYLAGTARPSAARMSKETATSIGAADGETVSVSTSHGSISLPLEITEMADDVVWLPLNSDGSAVHEQLGVTTGAIVGVDAGVNREAAR